MLPLKGCRMDHCLKKRLWRAGRHLGNIWDHGGMYSLDIRGLWFIFPATVPAGDSSYFWSCVLKDLGVKNHNSYNLYRLYRQNKNKHTHLRHRKMNRANVSDCWIWVGGVYGIYHIILPTFLMVLKLDGENISSFAGTITKSLEEYLRNWKYWLPREETGQGRKGTFSLWALGIFLFCSTWIPHVPHEWMLQKQN